MPALLLKSLQGNGMARKRRPGGGRPVGGAWTWLSCSLPCSLAELFSLLSSSIQARQLLRSIPEFAPHGWISSQGCRQPQAAVAVKVLAGDALDFRGDCTVQDADRSLFCSLGRTGGRGQRSAGQDGAKPLALGPWA